MTDPAPGEGIKGHMTTVTCRDCGVVYVQSDQDKSDYQHFCEMKTMAPPSSQAVAPSSPASDSSNSDVTVVRPSEVMGERPQATRRQAPAAGADDPNLPQEVRDSARDPARTVKQYILVKQIGKGGMGTVWKGWDRNLSRWVAIKFLIGDSEEEVDRFNREAKVAASVRHPNIASIFEIGEARGQHFIAMEFIDGLPMDQVKAPVRDLVEMMRQVSLAMDTAHKAGIIHRDLKPQNVMVTKQGWPFVLDFGLAKQVSGGQNLSVTGTIMGTPAFMPPEQAQGQTSKIDARSDVYSLGATLYALVTRQVPFKGETPMDTVMKVIKEEPTDPCKLNKECPPEVSTVVLKAMEKEAERRYQTAADFAEDLRRFLHDESLLAKPPSIHYKIVKSLQRNKLKYALGGTIVLALGVVTTLAIMLSYRKTELVGPAGQEFVKEWKPAARQVSFLDYEVGKVDLQAFDKAIEKMKPLKVDEVKVVADEVADQARAGDEKLKGWGDDRLLWVKNKEEINRIYSWTRDVQNVLEYLKANAPAHYPAFQALPARFSEIGAKAARMAAFQGHAKLRILVAPYARLKSLRAGSLAIVEDGRPAAGADLKFSDDDLHTPIVLEELEIRDYDFELEHPQLGVRLVHVDAGQLKNGVEYVISGHMSQPASLTLKSQQ